MYEKQLHKALLFAVFTFTIQFKLIPEFKLLRALFAISKVSEIALPVHESELGNVFPSVKVGDPW